MLNFWATWCGPCRLEIPALATVYREYRDQGFELGAVNVCEKPERVSAFVESYEVPFTVLLDKSGAVRQAYFVRSLPVSVFLDEEGVIEAVHVGALIEGMLREYVERLFDSSPPTESRPDRLLRADAIDSVPKCVGEGSEREFDERGLWDHPMGVNNRRRSESP